MSKTAREVIARAVGNWEGNPGCRDEYLETADSILSALKKEGYEIMNAEEFAKALDKGRKFRDRIERQAAAIRKARLKRLMSSAAEEE